MYISGQMTKSIPIVDLAFVINDLQLQAQEFKPSPNRLSTVIIEVGNNPLGTFGCFEPTDCSSQFLEKETKSQSVVVSSSWVLLIVA